MQIKRKYLSRVPTFTSQHLQWVFQQKVSCYPLHLPVDATYETPASCTWYTKSLDQIPNQELTNEFVFSNKAFFNIWSACSYSTGENLFPKLEDWYTICRSSGINLPQSEFLAGHKSWGVDVPAWAKVDVPENDTMDMQEAVLGKRL